MPEKTAENSVIVRAIRRGFRLLLISSALALAGCGAVPGVSVGGGYAGGFGGHSSGGGGIGLSFDLGTILSNFRGDALPDLHAGNVTLASLRLSSSTAAPAGWILAGRVTNPGEKAASVQISVPCESQDFGSAGAVTFVLIVLPGAKAHAFELTAIDAPASCKPVATRAAAELLAAPSETGKTQATP